MEWIDTLWGTIAPYVYMAVSFIASTGIGALIGQTIVKRWYAKNSDSNLANTISTQVSSSIVSKKIQVSLETANKKLFKSLENNVVNSFENYTKELRILRDLIMPIGRIMLNFKGASEEEKEILLTAINSIEKINKEALTVIEETEPVVIEVEPLKSNDNLF